jgi:hypothetical protein
MTTPERYLELCELAYCGPDSPWIHEPRNRQAQVRWLWARLSVHGVSVSRDEVKAAMDAFSRKSKDTPGTSLDFTAFSSAAASRKATEDAHGARIERRYRRPD